MDTFGWIVASGLAMSVIALSGSATLLLPQAALARLLTPLVAFAAGTLLGGAFFHMLPAALEGGVPPRPVLVWTMTGFALFFALEQLLHWHHCRRGEAGVHPPLTWLILIGDGLHNFLGGVGVAAVFLVDVRLGIAAWLAAAAHEVPQELGDFGVLVHGGWEKRRALLVNLLSGLMFLVGGLATWAASTRLDVDFLVPFAAGNFIYLGASDLVPEVKGHQDATTNLVGFAAFAAGLLLLGWLGVVFH
jgi:zinc and cadmium transporter